MRKKRMLALWLAWIMVWLCGCEQAPDFKPSEEKMTVERYAVSYADFDENALVLRVFDDAPPEAVESEEYADLFVETSRIYEDGERIVLAVEHGELYFQLEDITGKRYKKLEDSETADNAVRAFI